MKSDLVRPEHNEMRQTIWQMLLEKTELMDGRQIRLLDKDSLLDGDIQASASGFFFPDLHLLVFLYGKRESEWQTYDDKLQNLLRKRLGARVLSITFRRETKREAERIADEIISKARLSNRGVPGDCPQPFVWDRQDRFCKDCGRRIGRHASKNSGRCQSCNLKFRMEKEKEALTRVSA